VGSSLGRFSQVVLLIAASSFLLPQVPARSSARTLLLRALIHGQHMFKMREDCAIVGIAREIDFQVVDESARR
jgi:hypothetical protein